MASISTTLFVAFFATWPTVRTVLETRVADAGTVPVAGVAAGDELPSCASATIPAPAAPPASAAAAIAAAILFLGMFSSPFI